MANLQKALGANHHLRREAEAPPETPTAAAQIGPPPCPRVCPAGPLPVAGRRRRRGRHRSPPARHRRLCQGRPRVLPRHLHGVLGQREALDRAGRRPHRPPVPRTFADRGLRPADGHLRAGTQPARLPTASSSTRRSSWPSPSAAPTATSTSTASSTRSPPSVRPAEVEAPQEGPLIGGRRDRAAANST